MEDVSWPGKIINEKETWGRKTMIETIVRRKHSCSGLNKRGRTDKSHTEIECALKRNKYV